MALETFKRLFVHTSDQTLPSQMEDGDVVLGYVPGADPMSDDSYVPDYDDTEVQFEDSAWTDNVNAIYNASSSSEELNESPNIFTAQKLVSTLPEDLGKEAIKGSLVGILAATGVDATDLLRDSALRKSVLTNYRDSVGRDMDNREAQLRAGIEESEAIIEAAKEELGAIRSQRASIAKSVEQEINIITDIESYLV